MSDGVYIRGSGTVWIAEWEWDDANLDELARHGVNRRTVLHVATEAPRFRRSKKGRAASHQMIGPDRSGQLWTICIANVYGERWRAVPAGHPRRPNERGTNGLEEDEVSDAQELYEHTADNDEWEEEPADISVRPSTTEVVSFRIASDELDRVQSAAARDGVSLSVFIRSALHQAVAGGPTAALDDVWIGAIKVILGPEWRRVSRPSASSAPERPPTYQVVPNYPPSSQNVTSSEGAARLDDTPRLPLNC